MELLLRKINADTIQLTGMWCKDEIMCYLHVAEKNLMQGHSTIMVASGITTSYQ